MLWMYYSKEHILGRKQTITLKDLRFWNFILRFEILRKYVSIYLLNHIFCKGLRRGPFSELSNIYYTTRENKISSKCSSSLDIHIFLKYWLYDILSEHKRISSIFHIFIINCVFVFWKVYSISNLKYFVFILFLNFHHNLFIFLFYSIFLFRFVFQKKIQKNVRLFSKMFAIFYFFSKHPFPFFDILIFRFSIIRYQIRMSDLGLSILDEILRFFQVLNVSPLISPQKLRFWSTQFLFFDGSSIWFLIADIFQF